MKKSVMVLSLVVMGILFAGGVAFAANVRCEAPNSGEPAPCLGTKQDDRILGSEGDDDIRAKQGDDFVSGFDGEDEILGGIGADTLKGNTGPDFIAPFAAAGGETPEETRFVDDSDDIVNGGAGDDYLLGGFGQGGRDRVFGANGDDIIFITQRALRAEGADTKITREVAQCGAGIDTIYYDFEIDQINTDNCELQYAVAPDGEPVEPQNGAQRIAQEIPDVLAALKDIA